MQRRMAPLLATCLLLTACSPSLSTIPRYGSPPAEAQLIQSEYDTLLNDYVLPLDPSVLGLAAATGMRNAVAQKLGDAAASRFPFTTFTDNGTAVRTEIAQEYTAVTRQYPQIRSAALAHEAMASMAQSVDDCHTTFFTPAQYQEQQAELQGTVQFGGIGASLRDRPGSTPLIGEVFSGLPAAKAGLQRGDAIETVNGRSVQGMSASDVVALIRGPVGTVVHLEVQRAGQGLKDFAITRQDVTPPALTAGTLASPSGTPIGYVHLYAFTPEMPQQLQQALQQLAQRGAGEVIVDLRDNGGGTLQSLVATASLFLPQGPIARFQDRSGQVHELDATGQTAPAPQKVVLLVNHDSASASEIFAAALQERSAVSVVGTQTAGCVAVGEVHPLADGSAIEYAADKVFSPVQNRLLNGAGVVPDVRIPMSLDQLAAGQDPQLAAAEAVLLGQAVPSSPSASSAGGAGSPPKFIPGVPVAPGS
jgi:carboxyl-terminal processing protease